MDCAVMSGGDVGPLGKDAVTELHGLFKWAAKSPRFDIYISTYIRRPYIGKARREGPRLLLELVLPCVPGFVAKPI